MEGQQETWYPKESSKDRGLERFFMVGEACQLKGEDYDKGWKTTDRRAWGTASETPPQHLTWQRQRWPRVWVTGSVVKIGKISALEKVLGEQDEKKNFKAPRNVFKSKKLPSRLFMQMPLTQLRRHLGEEGTACLQELSRLGGALPSASRTTLRLLFWGLFVLWKVNPKRPPGRQKSPIPVREWESDTPLAEVLGWLWT